MSKVRQTQVSVNPNTQNPTSTKKPPQSTPTVNKETETKTPEKFTFFYEAASPFSQFHPATFHGTALFPNDEDKNSTPSNFLHCEQWMMYNKAKLFRDSKSAEKILKTSEPGKCKQLGRKVENFDQLIWNENNEAIIYEGNRLKFSQNSELLQKLLDTRGTTLVEASPRDRIYGIGLSANNPKALCRKTWRGRNLLGETLTKLREEFARDKTA